MLDVTCLGRDSQRQSCWKRRWPLTSLSDRLWQLEVDDNAMWLTAGDGPECVPLDDDEFRINLKMLPDLPVPEPTPCQQRRRAKADGTPAAHVSQVLGSYRRESQPRPPVPDLGRQTETPRRELPHPPPCLRGSRTQVTERSACTCARDRVIERTESRHRSMGGTQGCRTSDWTTPSLMRAHTCSSANEAGQHTSDG